jgi:hypothetical protein
MTWGFVAAAGSTLVGAYGANKAAKAQLQGAREGAAAEERMFNRQVALQEPFREVGVNALPELVEASRYDPFTLEKFQADPGYQFRLREGLKALDSTAAARGGLLSGAQLRGVTRFGQELGSQEFDKAFNRYNIGFKNRLNPLQSLAGVGQTSTNTLSNAAGQLGSSLSNLAVGAGNARASGYAGTANALASGIGQGYNYYQGNQAAKQQQGNFDTYMKYLQG